MRGNACAPRVDREQQLSSNYLTHRPSLPSAFIDRSSSPCVKRCRICLDARIRAAAAGLFGARGAAGYTRARSSLGQVSQAKADLDEAMAIIAFLVAA